MDEACHQEGTGQLKYLPPDKCISRLQEVTHAKESARQIELEQTRLVIREAQESPNMPASSALQVLEALRRRGLAYVFAQAVPWTEYDRYLTKLFAHMSRGPPPGFNRVSVSQIVEADRQVFVRVIEANVKPCKTSSGVMPMDDALMNALESYEVSFVLMHTPSKVTPAPKRPPKRPRLVPPADAAPIKGKGKLAKVSGKGKGAPAWAAILKQIRDLQGSANTPTGDPICFSYNLST